MLGSKGGLALVWYMLWFNVNANVIIISSTESVVCWTQNLYTFLALSQAILSCGIYVFLIVITSILYGDTQVKEPGELPYG